jgi:hypothetical protein
VLPLKPRDASVLLEENKKTRRLGVAKKNPRDASVTLEENIKKMQRLGVAKKPATLRCC